MAVRVDLSLGGRVLSTTPRQVRKWGLRAAAFSGAISVVILFGWAFDALPSDRPFLVLMVYLLTLTVAGGGALSALAANMHLTIGMAFSAGVRTGQAGAWPPKDAPQLRLVE